MKQLLIALIAFALTLGVACKKETNELNVKSSIEQKAKADKADLNVNVTQGVEGGGTGGGTTPTPGGGGGYPSGENTFPHNTGACACGQYPLCHPPHDRFVPHAPIYHLCSGYNAGQGMCIPY